MIEAIAIGICIVLLIIAVQDMRARAVDIWVFPVLAFGGLAWFYYGRFEWVVLGKNLAFIGLLFLSLTLYVSLKEKALTNIFKANFGLGDLLFLIAVSPLFSARNMILYVIFGMIFSLILHLIINGRNPEKTVPLAGYLSVFLMGIFTSNFFVPFNLFYTDLI